MQTQLHFRNHESVHHNFISINTAQIIITGLAIITAILALIELAAS